MRRLSRIRMLNVYCFCLFLSQFKYIFSFSVAGVYINPIRIALLALIVFDIIINHGKIQYNSKGNCEWIVALLAWNVWTVLSLVWAQSKSSVVSSGIILFEAFLFVYYGQRLITDTGKLKKVLNSLFAALVFHNFLGWMEVSTKVYLFSIYSEKYSMYGYPVSTFTNTNNFAFYLSLMAILLLIAISIEKRKLQKVIYICLLVSSLVLNVKTGSRGSVIALLAGVLIYVLLMAKSRKIVFRIIAVAAVIALFLWLNPGVYSYILEIIGKAFDINTSASTGTDYYRMNAYANGLDFYFDTYGLGVGPGNVEYWMTNYGTRFTNNIPNLHNWWLEILVGSGTVIAAIVAVTWIKYYIKLIKAYRSDKTRNEARYIICGAISFGVVFAIGCISPSTLYSFEWPWALLAVFFLAQRVVVYKISAEN